ncbi:TniQ family protein [Jannaschia formosa]|uniref:TniQ family protein n=1 Tax=Jannaschia formosa TaxID=2259592 RepID=UPI00142F3F8D|nr:TniQ family protein [Jannaschia formosa]
MTFPSGASETLASGVCPAPRETMLSLLSRAAAFRGFTTWEMTAELGVGQKGLLDHAEGAVAQVRELMSMGEPRWSELISWTPAPAEGVRMRFRGEEVVSRSVTNPTVRGCPRCLCEDVGRAINHPADAMAMRGDWQLRDVHLCVRHGHPLIALWTRNRRSERLDYAARLGEIVADLRAGRLDVPPVEVTDYDAWLDERLGTGRDESWLGSLPVDVATKACQRLGEALKTWNSVEGEDDARPARARGYAVLREGPSAFQDTLHDLSSAASGPNDGWRKAFGGLYDWLADHGQNDPRYRVLRDLMREVILEEWSVAEGETILGVATPRRRRHSVASAAKAGGVSEAVMRALLVRHGLAGTDDLRPDARLTVDADQASPIVAQASRMIGERQLRMRMGIPSKERFESLVRARLLAPVLPLEVSKHCWDPRDADRMMDALLHHALEIDQSAPEWIHPNAGAKRLRVGIGVVIRALMAGTLRVGVFQGVRAYSALRVREDDLDVLRPNTPDAPTVSEYAAAVGLRREGGLNALIADGHVSTTTIFNPRTRREGRYMTEADIAAFRARFTTVTILSREHGLPA